MGILQDEMDRIVREMLTDKAVLSKLLRRIIEKHGIELTETQVEQMAQSAIGGKDTVSFEPEGKQAALPQSINITQDDLDLALRDYEADMEGRFERAIQESVEKSAPSILVSLYKTLPRALAEWHRLQRGFEKRHYARWKEGLDRLEMLIVVAQESGEAYVDDVRKEFEGQSASSETTSIDVLVRLHCRACRTARAILCLLKGGYADDAIARWRSLHEVAVTGLLIAQHGGDLPQRYLDHAAVERWRASNQYQHHCDSLGYEQFSPEELAKLKQDYDAVVAMYGEDFKSDYGWASAVLGKHRPTFTDVEAGLDMSHWRPFFKMACQFVHAGSQGLVFSLGIPNNADGMLLAGASDAGIADPGHCTAISLQLASVALLTVRPNVDGLVACRVLQSLCDDVGEHFFQAHESHRAEME